jgi:glycosyltransferase involved in cell wall biosynthesis
LTRNVLQFIGSFHQGGSERQAVQLTRLLAEDKTFRPVVATLDGAGVLRGEVEQLNLGDIPEFALTSFFNANMVRQVRRCAKFIKENDIKIVHTHDFYTNIFGMLAACAAGVKARIASKRETGGMRSKGQKLTEKQIFRLAKAIVVNSEAVKNYLIDNGINSSKLHTIYNGLDLERLKPKNENREEILQGFGLPLDKKLVTIVANLRHETKNYRMFLRAARKVKENFSEVAFVCAGEGELLPRMKDLAAELGIAEAVFFLGRCAEVAELLSVSEICVLSSIHEGFSNSILEYMSAARPVVATNVGGTSEAIEDGNSGFLLNSNDDQTMAEKILYLLQNKEKADEMGKRGRQIVEVKFSCEAQLEKTLALYEKCLS